MPALPRLVGLNGRSPSQTRKSPVCPLYSWIRCGARSRNLLCIRVVHKSGGSSTCESAESTWLTMRSFLIFTLHAIHSSMSRRVETAPQRGPTPHLLLTIAAGDYTPLDASPQ